MPKAEIQLRFTANETLKRIQADPDRLTQVLLNLYLNAIHAIGRQGTITVEAKDSGTDRVIITVTDSGKGSPGSVGGDFYTLFYDQS